MRIGIGPPAAVPGASAIELGRWAEESERLGFQSLGVLDRLVYDNLDPLVALSAAAARTERAELITTVLGVPWRESAVVLGKQLASLDRLSGGRLTAGLALGGWPEDYATTGTPLASRGAAFDEMLATMRRVWAGALAGASGPIPALPPARPGVLFGGLVPAAFGRVATLGDGGSRRRVRDARRGDRVSPAGVGRGLPAGAPADRRRALLLPRPRRRRDRR